MSIQQILAQSISNVVLENNVEKIDTYELLKNTINDVNANNNASMEMIDCYKEVKTIRNSISNMESIQVTVGNFKGDDKLNPATALLLNTAIKSVMQPFSTHDEKELIALEDISKDSEELVAYALEGIKDTIAELWRKLSISIKRSIETVKKWFSSYMGIIKRMGQSALVLADKAKNSDGVPVNEIIDVRNAHYLTTNDVLVGLTESGIASVSGKEYSSVNEVLMSGSLEYANLIGNSPITEIGKPDFGIKLVSIITAIRNDIIKNSKEVKYKDVKYINELAAEYIKEDYENRYYVYHNTTLPGDYQIVYAFPIDNRGVPVPVGHIADLYKKSPKTAKYRAFTAKEIYSYCKIISNVSDKIIDEKLGTGELYKLFEAAEEAGEVINDTMHKLSIDGDGEAHGNFKAALKNLSDMYVGAWSVLTDSREHMSDVLFAGYSFAADSFDNLSNK